MSEAYPVVGMILPDALAELPVILRVALMEEIYEYRNIWLSALVKHVLVTTTPLNASISRMAIVLVSFIDLAS